MFGNRSDLYVDALTSIGQLALDLLKIDILNWCLWSIHLVDFLYFVLFRDHSFNILIQLDGVLRMLLYVSCMCVGGTKTTVQICRVRGHRIDQYDRNDQLRYYDLVN